MRILTNVIVYVFLLCTMVEDSVNMTLESTLKVKYWSNPSVRLLMQTTLTLVVEGGYVWHIDCLWYVDEIKRLGCKYYYGP